MDSAKTVATTATPDQSASKNNVGVDTPDGVGMWPIIVLWIAVIYFFFMRPQKKKEQERKELLNKVEKGDKVITVGGIHGQVMKINDDVITLKVDDKTGATIKMTRAAVSSIPKKEENIDVENKNK